MERPAADAGERGVGAPAGRWAVRAGAPAPAAVARPSGPPWRVRLYTIIFESDTPAGRAFDLALIAAITAGVVVVMLESVATFAAAHGTALRAAEWGLTALFATEYALRLATVGRPLRYALSLLGLIDLAAVVSGLLGLVIPGGQYLTTVRVLRLLRIFRLLKLVEYTGEAGALARALRASRYRIGVFLFGTLTLVVVIGAVMYVVEGPEHGFTSVPRSMYWAIVTLTTVGYGDMSPKTDVGQVLASVVMLLGYGIIAIPTGIVTAEITNERVREAREGAAAAPVAPSPPAGRGPLVASPACAACAACGAGEQRGDARYCYRCGGALRMMEGSVAGA